MPWTSAKQCWSPSTSYRTFLAFALILSLTSCGQKEKGVEVKPSGVGDTELPEEFLSFYDRFHSDSLYQIEHILFPLQGQKFRGSEEEWVDENFKWQKETWRMHKPFDEMEGSFKQEFTSFEGIVTEVTQDVYGQFNMVRRFAKMDSTYYLIYYKAMGL